jgi:TolB-like protein
VCAVGALAFVAGYLTGKSASPGVAPTPAGTPIAQTSLAVLPFDTWSENPDDDLYSDSLTHEVSTLLTQEGVRVVPYAMVKQFRSREVGRDEVVREIPHIADRLGASAVVLGSVTREVAGALLVSINLFDGERGELLSRHSMTWRGLRTGRRSLREYVVPQIVRMLNR